MKACLSGMFLVSLCLILLGCAQLGLPQAETFNEKLAVAYGTVSHVRVTAADLLNAKKISSDDAQNVQNVADASRTGLDVARKLHSTDAQGAEAKLSAIRTTLAALSTYLATKGK